jgi:hypothetical protein
VLSRFHQAGDRGTDGEITLKKTAPVLFSPYSSLFEKRLSLPPVSNNPKERHKLANIVNFRGKIDFRDFSEQ